MLPDCIELFFGSRKMNRSGTSRFLMRTYTGFYDARRLSGLALVFAGAVAHEGNTNTTRAGSFPIPSLTWNPFLRYSPPLACDSVVTYEIAESGKSRERIVLESTRPSLDFVPHIARKIFPLLCWLLLGFVWLCAAAAPIYIIFCTLTGRADALLSFLSIWLLGSVVKFPHMPCLTEAITTGIEMWFRDFSIGYEHLSHEASVAEFPHRKTIYCYHPHGLFSIGAVLLAVDLIRRGEKISFVTSAHMRWFNPLLKIFMDMAGIEIVGASAAEVQAAMKRGDRSLILVPGGYEEAVLTENGFERLFLQDRMGFVKYAMRFGYSLTPVYAYGENDLYKCIPIASGVRSWLASWKIPIVVFYGDQRCPILPHSDSEGLRVIIGIPLRVDSMRNPPLEQLRAAHRSYVDRVTELYYRHNRKGDRPLEIV